MQEKLVEDLLSQMAGLTLQQKVEVLANLTLRLGIEAIPQEKPSRVTPDNVFQFVMQSREIDGETIPNSLAMQGLTMLLWLNQN